jgi:cytochrome c556
MGALRPTPVWIATMFLVSSCGGPAALRYEEEVDRTRGEAVHAVHEERLRQLMRKLDRLRDERLPKALDMEVELQRQGREVERVAQAMSESATKIRAAAPARLDADERQEFLALADELRRRSEALALESPQLTPAQRSERLAEIDVTCGRCHARFRIPGGPDVGR